MPNILFVDDEQRLLDGLARMLRPQRQIWNMHFALGGEAAIAQFAATRFDIIVCDMRMPNVDGMTVLRHVRDHHPSTVRIALSGQTDLATMTQTVTVVHQFIAKPCDAATLRSVLERVCMLQTLLQQPRLQQVVGHLGDLPVLPRIYDQLCLAFDDPETTMRQIVRIVEQDVAVAARCLQVANSAFFGLRRPVDTLDQAIAYLGMTTLRDLVLSSAVFSSFRPGGQLTYTELERLEQQAVLVANVARALLDDPELGQQAFLAGMLHDIGRLVLATYAPDAPAGRPTSDAACDMHAEIGAYLLGLWGLPHSIVEAVAFHHHPERVTSPRFDVLAAVCTANQLIDEFQHADDAAATATGPALRDYLEGVGAADRLDDFRTTVADLIGAFRE